MLVFLAQGFAWLYEGAHFILISSSIRVENGHRSYQKAEEKVLVFAVRTV